MTTTIQEEYVAFLNVLRQTNSEETIRRHEQSMRITFFFAVARMANLSDIPHEIKASIHKQAEDLFLDVEHGMYIEEVMQEVNAGAKKKKWWWF